MSNDLNILFIRSSAKSGTGPDLATRQSKLWRGQAILGLPSFA